MPDADTITALQARVAALEAELAATKQAVRDLGSVVVAVVRHHGTVGHIEFELNNALGRAFRLLGPAAAKAA